MAERERVSVVVLTKNEEPRIARCLSSVRWADELIVVDGMSEDRTVEICQRYGATVIARPFSGSFGEERNVGADAASGEWILQLDGDDVVSEELHDAIGRLLTHGTPHAAFNVRRKNNFLGHWMLHGGWHHYYHTLYRNTACRFTGRVHHTLTVTGTIGVLEAPVLHFPFTSLDQFVARQNRYTSLEAKEILDEQGVLDRRVVRYHLTWRPLKLFWKSYVKKQGFREGWYGLVFAMLYSWVHVLKWAKYWELVRGHYQPEPTSMSRLFRDPRLEQVLMLEDLVPGPAWQAVRDVERYAARSIAELAAAYWRDREGADRLAQDQVAAAERESTVVEYYRETGQYLYELTYAEGSVKRQKWLQVIERLCRQHGVRRALDVGGGIGTVSLYLGCRGIACDHLDVPGKTFDYARWRFKTHGVPVAMHEATQPWPAGPYDAVIAWDVLEHLKQLEEKVGWLARSLRPGGLLLHWSTFTECEGVHLPENHQYGDITRYDALLQRCGFRYQGQVKPGRLSRALRRLGWKTATLGVRLSPRLKFGGGFLLHRLEPEPALKETASCAS